MELKLNPELSKRKTRKQILSDWLEENLESLDPGTDEIAYVIFNKLLVEHSCCDVQTWQFNDEIYTQIVVAES